MHNSCFEPKLACHKIKYIVDRESIHNINPIIMKMRLLSGNLASHNEDNNQVFGSHFERVYNKNSPIDPELVK